MMVMVKRNLKIRKKLLTKKMARIKKIILTRIRRKLQKNQEKKILKSLAKTNHLLKMIARKNKAKLAQRL